MAFKTFETEDEYNEAFKERLERERRKYADYDALKEKAAKYDDLLKQDFEGKAKKARADYDALVDKYKDYDANITTLTERATKAENSLLKLKIANEHKLPLELADRITGADEKAMREDAETLSKYLHGGIGAPAFNPDPRPANDKDAAKNAAYRTLLNGLTKGN